MNNVVDFPDREYSVNFTIPKTNVVRIKKSADDKIKIEFTADGGCARVLAKNMHEAQDKVKKIFPDSNIVCEPWVAG